LLRVASQRLSVSDVVAGVRLNKRFGARAASGLPRALFPIEGDLRKTRTKSRRGKRLLVLPPGRRGKIFWQPCVELAPSVET